MSTFDSEMGRPPLKTHFQYSTVEYSGSFFCQQDSLALFRVRFI